VLPINSSFNSRLHNTFLIYNVNAHLIRVHNYLLKKFSKLKYKGANKIFIGTFILMKKALLLTHCFTNIQFEFSMFIHF